MRSAALIALEPRTTSGASPCGALMLINSARVGDAIRTGGAADIAVVAAIRAAMSSVIASVKSAALLAVSAATPLRNPAGRALSAGFASSNAVSSASAAERVKESLKIFSAFEEPPRCGAAFRPGHLRG